MIYKKLKNAGLALIGPFLPLDASACKNSTPFSRLFLRIHRFNYLWLDFFALALAPFARLSNPALIAFVINCFLCLVGVHIGYHRYFSHHAFQTGRVMKIILAWLGASAGQSGPIWWSSQHRDHHKYSDTPQDHHSPISKGIFYSHVGWLLDPNNFKVDWKNVKDLTQDPDLRWIEKYLFLPPLGSAMLMLALGFLLNMRSGQNTSEYSSLAWEMFVWGFLIAVFVSRQLTFATNSIGHLIGVQNYKTGEGSRNNFVLALFTLGSGWHNNHHAFPSSARFGLLWWQIDIGFYLLKLLEKLGLVSNLRSPSSEL